ncbi:hypothetical protein FRX31_005650, partial [Thalictrum thalictroides]
MNPNNPNQELMYAEYLQKQQYKMFWRMLYQQYKQQQKLRQLEENIMSALHPTEYSFLSPWVPWRLISDHQTSDVGNSKLTSSKFEPGSFFVNE